MEDTNEEYQKFVDKFKAKKTTDDCYTPDNIYETVLNWVAKEYKVNREKVVRPFWPGGDYLKYDYSDGCVVVDNPPFSIVTQICRDYMEAGIKFFLFAPHLTNFSSGAKVDGLTHIIAYCQITYENGAVVQTSFLTNLDPVWKVRSAPDLHMAVTEADKKNRQEKKKQMPKYSYPDEVITPSTIAKYAKYGVDFRVKPEDCYFIRSLESQRAEGKAVFGGGFLLSEKAKAEKIAAEKAATEKAATEKAAVEKKNSKEWELSESELKIIKELG